MMSPDDGAILASLIVNAPNWELIMRDEDIDGDFVLGHYLVNDQAHQFRSMEEWQRRDGKIGYQRNLIEHYNPPDSGGPGNLGKWSDRGNRL